MNFSGKFVLRLKSSLHRVLAKEAGDRGISLNTYCQTILENRFSNTTSHQHVPHWDKLFRALWAKFGSDLIGVVLFGSQATGTATETSDTDLLIVLSPSITISRPLYTWWDNEVPTDATINPHFVSLPDFATHVGGLWCEVAITGKILHQKDNHMTIALEKINRLIQSGAVKRYWTNGHPYWIWSKDEKSHIGT